MSEECKEKVIGAACRFIKCRKAIETKPEDASLEEYVLSLQKLKECVEKYRGEFEERINE